MKRCASRGAIHPLLGGRKRFPSHETGMLLRLKPKTGFKQLVFGKYRAVVFRRKTKAAVTSQLAPARATLVVCLRYRDRRLVCSISRQVRARLGGLSARSDAKKIPKDPPYETAHRERDQSSGTGGTEIRSLWLIKEGWFRHGKSSLRWLGVSGQIYLKAIQSTLTPPYFFKGDPFRPYD